MSPHAIADHLTETDGTHVLVLQGALDTSRAPMVKATIDDLIDAGARSIVLDLTAVDFMDSSGLVVLVTGAQRIRKATGDLRVAAPSEQVRRLLGLTRMDTVFGVYETRAEALGDTL